MKNLCKSLAEPIINKLLPNQIYVDFGNLQSSHGLRIDRIESLTKSFILMSNYITLNPNQDIIEWYKKAILKSVDPESFNYWGNPMNYSQILVEAANLVVGLWESRDYIWNAYTPKERQLVRDYLEKCISKNYVYNNWLCLKYIIETFLGKNTSETWSRINQFNIINGWYYDTHGKLNSVDLYNCYSYHYFLPMALLINSNVQQNKIIRDRLEVFCNDLVVCFDENGLCLLEGRSKIYRFAIITPLLLGKRLGLNLDARTEQVIINNINYWIKRNDTLKDGILQPSIDGEYIENYICAASPYFACNVFNGIKNNEVKL